MENEVIFEEEDTSAPQRAPVKRKDSSFNKLIIKMGLAKDDKQAQIVLLIIAVIGFVITLFNIFAFLLPHH
jgi:hypothetical protein